MFHKCLRQGAVMLLCLLDAVTCNVHATSSNDSSSAVTNGQPYAFNSETLISSSTAVPADGFVTTNESSKQCVYPSDAFYVLIKNQCPAAHPYCIIDMPFDYLASSRYRCVTAPKRDNNTVLVWTSHQLLTQVVKDNEFYGGYSKCMLTAFYGPGCPFSARMLHIIGPLPRLFPQLRIVATDATEHSRLNSRYGIIGTPTILLWIDGVAVARMDEAAFSIGAFANFIERWTDLKADHKSLDNYDEINVSPVELKDQSFDWILYISWISFILSVTYFLINSNYGKIIRERVRAYYDSIVNRR